LSSSVSLVFGFVYVGVHLYYDVIFIHTNYLDFFLHPQLRILPVKYGENIHISPPRFTRCNIHTSAHPHFTTGSCSVPVRSRQPQSTDVCLLVQTVSTFAVRCSVCAFLHIFSISQITYIVSNGALNSTHSLMHILSVFTV